MTDVVFFVLSLDNWHLFCVTCGSKGFDARLLDALILLFAHSTALTEQAIGCRLG